MNKLQKKSFLLGVVFGLFFCIAGSLTRTALHRTDTAKCTSCSNTCQCCAGQPCICGEGCTCQACAKPACPGQPTSEQKVLPEFPGASDQWKDGFSRDWIAAEKERHFIKPIADNKGIVTMVDSQREGDTYGNYTAADLELWATETERLVVEGSKIFHSADLLGSTNGTSCDMCHPDAEGTHAETYPKYQVQLGRTALLRDMANWCLENPCRAEPMSGDDYRMRAIEAYMQAQRSGKPMKYGKH